MPQSDRKRVKQNLQRSLGHLTTLKEYYAAVGKPFADVGLVVQEQTGEFPPDYLDFLEKIELCMFMCDELEKMVEAILKEL